MASANGVHNQERGHKDKEPDGIPEKEDGDGRTGEDEETNCRHNCEQQRGEKTSS
jgi:hypothetical protein